LNYLSFLYRKQWYEYDTQNKVVNSSTQLSKSSHLTLTFVPPAECIELLIMNINQVLTIAQIYHLEILEKIFIGTLIQTVGSLSELNSLKVHSLSLYQPRNLFEEEADILCSSEDIIQITKVYLEKMIEIQEVYFLMALCPYMEYLKVECINNMDVELFVRDMLDKINHERNGYLRLLCFHVRAADDKMIQKLEKMIQTEKLLVDYSIKRVCDNIYLQWK
jgi:hypothetical protein